MLFSRLTLKLFLLFSAMTYLGIATATAGEATKSKMLAAGKVHEECLNLNQTQRLNYSFNAKSGLDFNIHYHVGQNVHYPVKQRGHKRYHGIFRPDGKRTYCLMWTNRTRNAVLINYELSAN